MRSSIFRFADFELDQGAYALRRCGVTLSIERIPLELLFLLVEHRGQLVTRSEILRRIWGEGVFVDGGNAINTAIRKLRSALKDDPKRSRFVATVPTKGYRFVGVVEGKRDHAESETLASTEVDRISAGSRGLIVGREEELSQLDKYFERAKGGARQILFVTGEPGIGKTALVQSFLSSLGKEKDVRIGRGQCIEQYGSGEPYMPVLEALTRLCRHVGGERLIEILNEAAPSWLVQMPSLLNDSVRKRLKGVTQGVTHQRMLREITEALEAITAEAPVVLAFEDLHWSDSSTLEFIASVARRSETARLLILGTYRPVEILANGHPLRAVKEELELQRRCAEMKIKLLSSQDVAAYLALRFSGQQSLAELAPVIHHRTEGNPLFMVNVSDYLVERGSLRNPGRIEAPPTIQQMIQRNLERLAPDEEEALEAASVAGIEFSAATVAAALEKPLSEIEMCCSRLTRREQFISATGAVDWPDGSSATRFRFQHALYRDVLYARVPPNGRAQLHQRILGCLETAYGERADEIASELAHHCRKANDRNKAVRYLAAAGEQAIQRSANADAVANLSEALLLLNSIQDDTDRSDTELRLQIMLGGTLTATKGFAAPEVKRSYSRAFELCKGLRKPSQFPALYGLWVYYLTRGEVGVAKELAENQCLRLAETVRDPALIMQAHLMVGGTAQHFGDFATARLHLDQSLALYDSRIHRNHAFIYGQDPGTIGRVYVALALWSLGFPDQALEKLNEALGLASELQYPLTSAFANGFAAWLHQVRGEVEASRTRAETAITLASEYGFPLPLGMGRIFRGWALAELGHHDEGIELIRQGRDVCEGSGAALIRPYFLTLLAKAYGKGNRLKEGQAALAEALASIKDNGERAYEADILRLQAEFLLADSANDEAERQLYSAIKLAQMQKAKSLELRATTTLARLLTKRDRRGEARTMLREIYNWFTEGFDTAALREARFLLEQLA